MWEETSFCPGTYVATGDLWSWCSRLVYHGESETRSLLTFWNEPALECPTSEVLVTQESLLPSCSHFRKRDLLLRGP